MSTQLAIKSLDEFVYGRAPRPVTCGRDVVIGDGTVIPEINFTLPPIDICQKNWPEIRAQYTEMIDGICQRAVDLEVPALLVEFETLPPMTVQPAGLAGGIGCGTGSPSVCVAARCGSAAFRKDHAGTDSVFEDLTSGDGNDR